MIDYSKYEGKPELYFKARTRQLKTLSTKAMKKAMAGPLYELRDRARKNLLARVKGADKINPKFNDSLVYGIRVIGPGRDKKNKQAISGVVSIASNRKTGSGSYRLHFLEETTKPRYTKKGYYRGIIKGRHFFKDAHTGSEEADIQKAIDKAMDEVLKKCSL